MNMPQPEFYCGRTQDTRTWQDAYRHQIFIFERHRVFEPSRDLAFLIARWLRKKQRLPQDSGFVHQVQFPEQPEMEMLGWTAHRAFHLVDPIDERNAPSQLVLFTSIQHLCSWKRAHWQRRNFTLNKGFIVHANCYEPSGQRMLDHRLLTF